MRLSKTTSPPPLRGVGERSGKRKRREWHTHAGPRSILSCPSGESVQCPSRPGRTEAVVEVEARAAEIEAHVADERRESRLGLEPAARLLLHDARLGHEVARDGRVERKVARSRVPAERPALRDFVGAAPRRHRAAAAPAHGIVAEHRIAVVAREHEPVAARARDGARVDDEALAALNVHRRDALQRPLRAERGRKGGRAG